MKMICNPFLFRKYYYFSLKEIYKFVVGSELPLYKDDYSEFYEACAESPYNVSFDYAIPITSAELDIFFGDFLSYYENVCCVRTTSPELKYTDVLPFIVKIAKKFYKTYEYYTTILKAYRDSKNQLLEDIKVLTKGSSRFNDTPQLEGVETYEDDDYATNLTISAGESSTPLNTKIMRLKEIQDHYKRIMADWIAEFHSIFYNEIEEVE